ncbi:Retrovirus-related Pol polyprotein from transposon opus [Xyrichtys novacula]|uniref:Retrovirus-related Pol polyprotein from transposon opus n=1 Tax=Xyrichtys novacula TaxID=13765 RepID=A0AAV1EXT7_XYRNO|nr:Retrovirus-related Pol polyprotein from transposon opus [Xyrichtys novacula]
MLSMTVRDHALPFLVDTGATRSTVNQDIGPLSERTMSVVGFSGSEPILGARNLYTDGCCYRDEKEGLRAGFSVIEETPDGLKTVTAQKLNGPQSAQRAEVVAVIEALKAEISKEQDLASPEEKTVWKLRGAVLSEGTWRSPDGRLVLPPGLKDSIFSEAHGVGHAGISQMKVDLKEWWHPFLHDMLKEWHGFPEKIRSDNGSHFKNQDLQTTGDTPFELERGRPFPGPERALQNTDPPPSHMHQKDYYVQLQSVLSEFAKQVRDSKDGTKDGDLPITDWVLLRVIKRKWSEPRWTGPFQVTERTSHAVRLDRKGDTCFHLTQCAPAVTPQRSLKEVRQDLAAAAAGNQTKEPYTSRKDTGQNNPCNEKGTG